MKFSMTNVVQRELSANPYHSLKRTKGDEDGIMEDKPDIMGNRFLSSLRNKQEEKIESIMTKLDCFRELAWNEIISQCNCMTSRNDGSIEMKVRRLPRGLFNFFNFSFSFLIECIKSLITIRDDLVTWAESSSRR